MSLKYCEECDRMIDLDNDEHWEHFDTAKIPDVVGIPKIILDMKNLGKSERKIFFDLYQKEVDKFEKNIREVILKQMKGGKENELYKNN